MPSDPSGPTDEALANAHLSGDTDAFAVLVERYARGLYGYARRLTGNEEDAEDITQETFVRLFDHLSRLDRTKPLKPWLFHVCTNLCRNLAKRKKTIPFSELEKDETEHEEG